MLQSAASWDKSYTFSPTLMQKANKTGLRNLQKKWGELSLNHEKKMLHTSESRNLSCFQTPNITIIRQLCNTQDFLQTKYLCLSIQ